MMHRMHMLVTHALARAARRLPYALLHGGLLIDTPGSESEQLVELAGYPHTYWFSAVAQARRIPLCLLALVVSAHIR